MIVARDWPVHRRLIDSSLPVGVARETGRVPEFSQHSHML